MSENLTPAAPPAPHKPRASVKNVLVLLLPLAAAVGAVGGYFYWKFDAQRREHERIPFGKIYSQVLDTQTGLDPAFTDADGDLVADAPKDAAKLLDPPTLTFAVLGSDAKKESKTWKSLVERLEKATGKKVDLQLRAYTTKDEFVTIKDGPVHLLQLNTGAVPPAVALGGFVPLVVPAAADGSFGFQMEFIIPTGGKYGSLDAFAADKSVPADQKVMTLGNNRSFSGYKAPLVLLADKYGLNPYRDYDPRYGGRTEDLVKGIKAKRFQITPVAGDYLRRLVRDGVISADDYKTIYTSEKYPPACVGCVHNLKPPLREQIEKVLVNYEFKGTSLEPEYLPADQVKYVRVDYKKDFTAVRKVEDDLRRLVESWK